jgi:hypothetical protein
MESSFLSVFLSGPKAESVPAIISNCCLCSTDSFDRSETSSHITRRATCTSRRYQSPGGRRMKPRLVQSREWEDCQTLQFPSLLAQHLCSFRALRNDPSCEIRGNQGLCIASYHGRYLIKLRAIFTLTGLLLVQGSLGSSSPCPKRLKPLNGRRGQTRADMWLHVCHPPRRVVLGSGTPSER